MNRLFAQLKPVLDSRQAAGEPLHIFFRNDDVDEDEPSLRRLLDLFLRREAPINLGVIPGRLTDAATRLLAEYRRASPPLLEFDQHGWRHVNREPVGKKCEFGGSRNISEQLTDLARGKARMEAVFGEAWFPAFIPPWNRCTAETYRALDELGFLVLSKDRGRVPVTGYGFREISVTLDLFRWRGRVELRPAEEIVTELISQLGLSEPVGLMLHHKVMSDEAFSLVDWLLETLNQFPIVRYHTFESLLKLADRRP